MMDRETELLTKAKAAIMAVNRALGSPGDYGYSTKEGKALNELYNLHNDIADELKLLAEMEASMSEPLSAAEQSVIDQSWQRYSDAAELADLKRSVMKCSTLADLRSVQITIQRISEASEPWDVEISHN